jgi:hypothetical protein
MLARVAARIVSFGLALVGVSPSPGSRVGTASRGCRCPMCSCGPSPASLRGKLQLHLHPWLPRRASSCSASAARAGRRGSAPPAARKASCSPCPSPLAACEASRSHGPLSSGMCPAAGRCWCSYRRPVTEWLEGRAGPLG